MRRLNSKRSIQQAFAELKTGEWKFLKDIDKLLDEEEIRDCPKAYKSLKTLWEEAVKTYRDIESMEDEVKTLRDWPRQEEIEIVREQLLSIAKTMESYGSELDRIVDQDFAPPPGPS